LTANRSGTVAMILFVSSLWNQVQLRRGRNLDDPNSATGRFHSSQPQRYGRYSSAGVPRGILHNVIPERRADHPGQRSRSCRRSPKWRGEPHNPGKRGWSFAYAYTTLTSTLRFWPQRRRSVGIGLALLTLAAGGLLILRPASQSVYNGRPFAYWFSELNSPSYQVRNEAEVALRGLGVDAVPYLRHALRVHETRWQIWFRAVFDRFQPPRQIRVPPARIQEQAARLLARLGPAALPATPELIGALAGQDPDTVRACATALRRIGPQCVPDLVAALHHSVPAARANAAELLGSAPDFDRSLDAAVLPLETALADPDREVRRRAAPSLATADRSHARSVPALTAALLDTDQMVRLAAARSLGELGPVAAASTPALAQCLVETHPEVRVEAARALWRIEHRTDRPLPVLVASLRDQQVHWQAALALGEIGAPAEAAIPALLEALENELVHRPSRTPASSALALARMSPAAVPGLVLLLSHHESYVRVGAAIALAGQGINALPALSRLLELLDDPDPEVRLTVTGALGAIGTEARAAVPKLEAMIQDGDEITRTMAQSALNHISTTPSHLARGSNAPD